MARRSKCKGCGSIFIAKVSASFCNKRCYQRYSRSVGIVKYKPRLTVLSRTCKTCGISFETTFSGKRYCKPECRPKPFNVLTRFSILSRDGFCCGYCGVRATDGAALHVDHIEPLSRGGADSAFNMLTACSECNLSKSAVSLSPEVVERLQRLARSRNDVSGISQAVGLRNKGLDTCNKGGNVK